MSDTEPERPRLAAVPDENTADRRAPVARWVITLSEPLISTRQRTIADRQMARFISRNSRWATAWFAGVISDIAETLPPDDPWRRLSAYADFALISLGESSADPDTWAEFTNPHGEPAPGVTGAVCPGGEAFGTVRDSTDLVMSELGPADLDIGLAAVSEDVDSLTAAIIGFSASNSQALESVLTRVYHHMWLAAFSGREGVGDAGETFLEIVGEALRRIIHRRRAYTGAEDPFPTVAGFAWMARADRIVAGGRNIASEVSLARDARIDPGAYGEMRAF